MKEEKCIYFSKDKKDLNYKKQEHIIPASLGGIKKLPVGAVSDEANELFSKNELRAVRYSFLSVNRDNNGPGKRGSFSINKLSNVKINLFEINDKVGSDGIDAELIPIRLGFIFCGTVHLIPQIYFPIKDDGSIAKPRMITDMSSLAKAENDSNNVLLELDKLKLQKQIKYTNVKTNLKVNIKYFCIGMYRDKWYVSSSLNQNKIDIFFEILKCMKLPDHIPLLTSTVKKYHYSYQMQDIYGDSMQFVYLKTAFNCLAFFKGISFVLDSQFDDVRQAIVKANNLNTFYCEKKLPTWLIEFVNKSVKYKEHFIVINAENDIIEAYVSFYREKLSGSWILSKCYKGENFRKFFICDWKNKNEKWSNQMKMKKI